MGMTGHGLLGVNRSSPPAQPVYNTVKCHAVTVLMHRDACIILPFEGGTPCCVIFASSCEFPKLLVPEDGGLQAQQCP